MLRQLQYFGTDGIRGTVGKPPMCKPWLESFAKALAAYVKLKSASKDPMLALAWDTRASGEDFGAIFEACFSALGIQVFKLGMAPTPALALITKNLKADLGLMITASHNPASDNGLKFFDRQGYKLKEADCLEIEALLEATKPLPSAIPAAVLLYKEWVLEYKDYLKGGFSKQFLKGLKIVLDTAHGAMCKVGPLVLKELGAEVIHLGGDPDGYNINQYCGSEAPQAMQKAVLEHRAHMGIAFDGDGDRVRFCDEKGALVEGEKILAILALELFEKGQLCGHTLVTTVHSNTGLDRFLAKIGVKTLRTPIGDKYILEKMVETGAALGGESSGHLLFHKELLAGDGLYGALSILAILAKGEVPFSFLANAIELFPQVQANLPVKEKKPIAQLDALSQAIQTVEKDLGQAGRVLIRYSGTEHKIRLLVEGPDTARIEGHLATLIAALKKDLGD